MTTDTAQSDVKWGKVIDNRKCIGCHACSVACKQEHDVPIGVNRTFVKQVEVGTFPNVKRHFQVTRCNQCEDAPCVEICPTTAMFQRPDGIVDFDRSRCIGCQACMAACPYDAIYIDPTSHSAEKCNFCAHRIDRGLQPACVVVCPTQAIYVGDLNDSESEVSKLITNEKTDVRKPEKHTDPKVFYVEAAEVTLTPSLAGFAGSFAAGTPLDGEVTPGGESVTLPREGRQKATEPGLTAAAALLSYDNTHRAPWNWIVSLYTWTKSIAGGTFLVAAVLGILDYSLDREFEAYAALAAGAFLGLTALLLVADLHHPERFIFTLIKPQWRSWVARGSYLITFYGLSLGLFLLALLVESEGLKQAMRWPGALLAIGATIYTAFLFGQAKGRDLWQEPALPLHLLTQAVVAGSAALVVLASAVGVPGDVDEALRWTLVGSLALHLLLAASQIVVSHESTDGKRASRNMLWGRYAAYYWTGVLIGALLPLVLVLGASAGDGLMVSGAVAALVGLALYEHAYVQAGQSVPLS